jgi:hypothetical protein
MLKPTALTGCLAVLALSLAWQVEARGQWAVSLAVESDRYWGGSVDNTPEHKSFRPYRPTAFTVGLERRAGNAGLRLRTTYTEASLGLEGEGAVVAAKGAFTVWGIAPELSYQIATIGQENRLLLQLGPLLELWHPIDEEWRTRLGAQGGLSLVVPLGGRFDLALGGTVAVISSPFHSDELPVGYEVRALWRRGFSGGLVYQL